MAFSIVAFGTSSDLALAITRRRAAWRRKKKSNDKNDLKIANNIKGICKMDFYYRKKVCSTCIWYMEELFFKDHSQKIEIK